MRGTVAFEKLSCEGDETAYLRLLLNDAVYPVVGCSCGPGRSCPLQVYDDKVLQGKWDAAGKFEDYCELPEGSATTSETGGVTFFYDWTIEAIGNVRP